MKKTIYCHLWIYVTFLKQNVSIVKTIKIYKKGRHFENVICILKNMINYTKTVSNTLDFKFLIYLYEKVFICINIWIIKMKISDTKFITAKMYFSVH